MTPMDQIANLLSSHIAPTVCKEQDLGDWVFRALHSGGRQFDTERRLSARDRVDFLVGRVAIELKVDGPMTRHVEQLDRYAESDEVDEILLVTTKATHRRPDFELRGKRVQVLWVPTL